MKKQTAIEWLYELSKKRKLDNFDFEQAKAIEKEQIIEANDNGYIDGGNNKPTTAEQYYNKTFKSDDKTSF